ncbi:ThiF family adenylyltransferase [Shewanella sp.]|uniref:HesA/MoeB/ThiF family protein n=1 Tax=Shewanella sp. TaxID=50422 RepID=UPI00356A40E3
MLSDNDFLRFSRQILLPECGEAGQLKLRQSRVAIIGVGGLGCQVAQLLAAAGIGELWLFDDDRVELSNLPRQLLFTDADIGHNKAQVAAGLLSRRYGAAIHAFGKLDDSSIHVLGDIHWVVDCSDNFATRHRLAAHCYRHQKTLISGAIAAFEGLLFLQSANANGKGKGRSTVSEHPLSVSRAASRELAASGCYHCLFPQDTESATRCATQGVLGSAVAAIAALQAQMTQQLILGMPLPSGRMQRFDFRHFRWHEARVPADPHCAVCAGGGESDGC